MENKKDGRGNGEERGLDGLFLAGTKATVLVNFRKKIIILLISNFLLIYLFICLFIYLSIDLLIYLFIAIFIFWSIYLLIFYILKYLYIDISMYWYINILIYLSIYLSSFYLLIYPYFYSDNQKTAEKKDNIKAILKCSSCCYK